MIIVIIARFHTYYKLYTYSNQEFKLPGLRQVIRTEGMKSKLFEPETISKNLLRFNKRSMHLWRIIPHEGKIKGNLFSFNFVGSKDDTVCQIDNLILPTLGILLTRSDQARARRA
jgi:hypothetical protein